ncbi:MAG: hypothetical protein A2V88_08950 [Elusimicrobia bacterium RBG_16_66_12]|nr:MAG: hypothetical protein A2V88_08950 [Elusimicrobia bacterium RBG_16_66_12]
MKSPLIGLLFALPLIVIIILAAAEAGSLFLVLASWLCIALVIAVAGLDARRTLRRLRAEREQGDAELSQIEADLERWKEEHLER